MRTESRNLDFRHLLSVIERQEYRSLGSRPFATTLDALAFGEDESTEVTTTVTLVSRLGERFRRQPISDSDEAPPAKVSFLQRWSQSSLQRSIEAIGLNRTSKSQPNAKEGMKIVLERLRQGGLVAVLEGMRQDREQGMIIHGGGFKKPGE